MTKSVCDISCDHCENKFSGVLSDLFDVSKTYAAECPNCSKQTFFNGVCAIIDGDIPKDAVAIKYVAVL